MNISPQRYAEARLGYHQSGERDKRVLDDSGASGDAETPDPNGGP
jgi:hypothetical protein